jgi:hypothetical protein
LRIDNREIQAADGVNSAENISSCALFPLLDGHGDNSECAGARFATIAVRERSC